MKVLLRLLIICGIVGILFVGGIFLYLYNVNNNLPKISSLSDYNPPVVTSIYSRDGELLLEIGKEKRIVASFLEIPQHVVNCFLAAEDDSFYDHAGVDFMGIFRSMIKNILAGRVVQGGSTITQQVAKTFFTTGERTISRKIKDMLLAKKIEENFTKSEILYLYLNQMYFGGGYYGVKMAAKGYFNKDLEDVTVAEGAMLAGLLARPHGYSPYVGPKYAKKRQRYVLRRLYDTGKINELEYEEAITEEIKIFPREDSLKKAGYFVDWVKAKLLEKIPEEEFMTAGYEVITSLDWKYQKHAEKSVVKGLKEIDKRQGYKGVLGRIESPESMSLIFKRQREKYFQEAEEFKTFTVDGLMVSEYEFIDPVKEERTFYSLLKVDDNLDAVVTVVDDENKKVTAKISENIEVIIDYEDLKWAKKRNISNKRSYDKLPQLPSEVLSVGDLILVQLKEDISPKEPSKPSTTDNLVETSSEDEVQFTPKTFTGILDQMPEVQGALLALETETGEILAMVGGRNYEESQFNRATQSKRQPGSIFKSFYYAAALEKGYTPATIVMDTPYALSGETEDLSWKPDNYDNKYYGPITFRRSLEKSRNIPSIKIAQDVGIGYFKNFLSRIGLDLDIPNDLSFSLGAFEARLIDLVKGYSVFATQGKRINMRSILLVRKTREEENVENIEENAEENFDDAYVSLDVDGDILVGDFEFYDVSDSSFDKISQFYQKRLSNNQVYDERLAYIMTNILKGVVRSGTGRRARGVSPFIAGKTGTTNDYIDAWFVGYSKKVVAGVWTGFDTNITLGHGEGGGTAALPLWANFMDYAVEDKGEDDFRAPPGIINVKINKETGRLASLDDRYYFMESFVQGTEPTFEESGASEFENQIPGDEINMRAADDDFFLNQ